MEDAQRKAILIGVGIGAIGYALGRLSILDQISIARIEGFKNGWAMRKLLMESIENVRTESEPARTASTDNHAGTTPCSDALPGDECNHECSTGLADSHNPEEIEDEVDCFGDAGNGIAGLSLQKGNEAT
jgi:hypothetical protein